MGLWALPEGGEARPIAHHPGDISAFAVAKDASTVAYTADLLPGAANAEAYAELRRERESAVVNAVLYEATTPCALGAGPGPGPGPDEPMYETALNFLDHHVLGQEWRRPAML